MLAARTERLREKMTRLGEEMRRLDGVEAEMLASPDQQVSLTDPDARSTACGRCAIKARCTPAKERRVTRWEHEAVLEAVQRRLDADPGAMRVRRETAEHPFGTLKARMGATHFLMKTLPRVSGEMALHVLAYNLTRVLNILGTRTVLAAMRA